jgi:hypothetical protein
MDNKNLPDKGNLSHAFGVAVAVGLVALGGAAALAVGASAPAWLPITSMVALTGSIGAGLARRGLSNHTGGRKSAKPQS